MWLVSSVIVCAIKWQLSHATCTPPLHKKMKGFRTGASELWSRTCCFPFPMLREFESMNETIFIIGLSNTWLFWLFFFFFFLLLLLLFFLCIKYRWAKNYIFPQARNGSMQSDSIKPIINQPSSSAPVQDRVTGCIVFSWRFVRTDRTASTYHARKTPCATPMSAASLRTPVNFLFAASIIARSLAQIRR